MEETKSLPKRLKQNQSGKKQNLSVNYFGLGFKNTSRVFYKYHIEIEPQVPDDAYEERRKIYRRMRYGLSSIGNSVFNNTVLYSDTRQMETVQLDVKVGETDYKVILKMVGEIGPGSPEFTAAVKKITAQIFGALDLKPFRKHFLDLSTSKTADNGRIRLVPAFSYTVDSLCSNMMAMKIDPSYKMLRSETVLEFMNKLRDRSPEKIKEVLIGSVVYTRYNKDKSYSIDDVNFDMSPCSEFDMKEEKKSFIAYFDERYKQKIHTTDQPMLVSKDKKDGREIYLVPELCYCTGLTDDMRSNFRLMKEINEVVKGNANQKVKECRNLIEMFENNEKAREIANKWDMNFEKNPNNFQGTVISAGSFGLRDGSVSADDPQLDRKIQSPLLEAIPLKTWAVLAGERDNQLMNTFLDTMQACARSFQYEISPPKVISVRGRNANDWMNEVKNQLNPSYQIIVFIVQGKFGKSQLYEDLKRFTLTECPIPTQFILTGTLSKPKGVRSVVNKVLVQMACKIGSTPWAMSDMPFSDKPCMVVGMSKFQAKGKNVIGFTSTNDRFFSKGYSAIIEEASKAEEILAHLEKAISVFENANGIKPARLFILNEGYGPSMAKALIKDEVVPIKTALEKISKSISLTYVTLTTRSTFKFFNAQGTNYQATVSGTLIDNGVVRDDMNDFYLVSAKSNQGVPSATHYTVIYQDEPDSPEDLHSFIYKLTFLYYNWVGAVKVPGPCQNAKKLATLIGEKISKRDLVKPNDCLETLYYL